MKRRLRAKADGYYKAWGTDKYLCLPAAARELKLRLERLPFSLKILLENCLRNLEDDRLADLLGWFADFPNGRERDIPLYPSRILMQDFTGVPAIADLAAMRDAAVARNLKAGAINPLIPVDLVIDHSITVERYADEDSLAANGNYEFLQNEERYRFLRWGAEAFSNFRVAPPGRGICHQINIERLGQVVSRRNGVLMPELVLGTDSHTTMINGLGILGWGVGGIEAEAALLGIPLVIKTPRVVGVELKGSLRPGITATDLVLRLTNMLREFKVVGQFVEFYGDGLDSLTTPDRATIANMSPEFGATCAVFPVDDETINYLRLTARSPDRVATVQNYCRAQTLWRGRPDFHRTLSLELGRVEAVLAGPKRPQELILLKDAPAAQLAAEKSENRSKNGGDSGPELTDGKVVIAAITSCTNTSNPSVMLAAGMLAKKAAELGLFSKPWVKTSLAPGSLVVEDYLSACGLMEALKSQGFHIVGYGCTTCIGNSGPLKAELEAQIKRKGLTVAAVLSGNRNFEGRIHPLVKCNYLASPPLVVAYALAGSMRINLADEPLGRGRNGQDIYLKDIWPNPKELAAMVAKALKPAAFAAKYKNLFEGDRRWNQLAVAGGETFNWQAESTYIKKPPFFADGPPPDSIKGARALALLGDFITTDHISPAGAIADDSPAGLYLKGKGEKALNSYGARRGNHEVMIRGSFANPRLQNFMVDIRGGFTAFYPPNRAKKATMTIFDAAMAYAEAGTPLVVFGGEAYGSGSSRDWAAKGPKLLGVRAVIASSFERIHRSNLVGMGVMPLQFAPGVSWRSLGLKGDEKFDILGLDRRPRPRTELELVIKKDDKKIGGAKLLCRLDTAEEADKYYPSGGVLPYALKMLRDAGSR